MILPAFALALMVVLAGVARRSSRRAQRVVAQITPAAAAEGATLQNGARVGEATVSPTSRGACLWCGPLQWQLEQTQGALTELKDAIESGNGERCNAALKSAQEVLE